MATFSGACFLLAALSMLILAIRIILDGDRVAGVLLAFDAALLAVMAILMFSLSDVQ